MRIKPCVIAIAASALLASCAPNKLLEVSESSSAAAPKFISGRFPIDEVSGAVLLGDKLLIAADDPTPNYPDATVSLVADAVTRLRKGGDLAITDLQQIFPAIENGFQVSDLEDACVAPNGDVFITSSHSRKSNGEEPASKKRKHLVRLRFNPAGDPMAVDIKTNLVNSLPDAIKDAPDSGPAAVPPGLNIEGLAADGPNLLIGLRAPTLHGQAVVLRLVLNGDSGRLQSQIASELPLGGRGIRGLCTDPKGGYWIIAGVSGDAPKGKPDLPNPWSIYFWDGKGQLEERFKKADLPTNISMTNPEAICLLPASGSSPSQLLLISDDGSNVHSPYLLMPVPEKSRS